MTSGLRVKFDPELRVTQDKRFRVLGGTLKFTTLSIGRTEAVRDEPKPARLLFKGAYLPEARSVSSPDFEDFASLEGQLALKGAERQPRFICKPEADFQYTTSEPADDEIVRRLLVKFDPGNFESAPKVGSPASKLRLLPEPKGSRFFELVVLVEVNGKLEGTHEDRLDIPLFPIRIGLVVQWPDGLDEFLPANTELIASQGGQSRTLAWSTGEKVGSFRRFFFPRIFGAAPVDLTARSGEIAVVLWDKQVTNDPDNPPRWSTNLEEAFRQELSPSKDFQNEGVAKPIEPAAPPNASNFRPTSVPVPRARG